MLSRTCAADTPSFAVSACHGDSGGPLVASTAQGETVEIGITSHGDPNCNAAYPSVFTRADAVSGWVAGWIAQTPSPPSPPASSASSAAAGSTPPASPTAPTLAAHRTSSLLPRSGAFSGQTGQRGGRLRLTIEGARIRGLAATFTLRCRGAARRRVHASEHTAISVKLKGNTWTFSSVFTDRRGWRYAISGASARRPAPRGRCPCGRATARVAPRACNGPQAPPSTRILAPRRGGHL